MTQEQKKREIKAGTAIVYWLIAVFVAKEIVERVVW
jgi:hypothetical protein